MKGRYGGPMSLADLYQALYQDRSFLEDLGITHVRAASLFFTPCDERGDSVIVKDQLGNIVEAYVSGGAYRSAADAYEKAQQRREPETRPVVRQVPVTAVPFSPL